MADSERGYKWWLRYVAVPILAGGGLAALIFGILNSRSPPESSHVVPSAGTTSNAAEARTEVQQLVAKWFDEFWSRNPGIVDNLVESASVPFYFHNEVIGTLPKLRSRFEEAEGPIGGFVPGAAPKVESINVQTLREAVASGHDLSRDRLVKALNVSMEDYEVTVMYQFPKPDGRREGMLIAVRKVGDEYKIIGYSD